MNYSNLINKSLEEFLKQNNDSILIGEDLLDPYGGAFKVSKNLSSKYKNQVIGTPISESAIIGVSSGLLISGHKVVVEIMFGDFLTLVVDQIHNGISKSIELVKEKKNLGSITIRVPMGGYRGYGCTHSQSIESLLFNTPNLEVFSPNIFINPGKLLTKAINKNTLSLFVEHKVSYSKNCEIKTFRDMDLLIDHFEHYSKIKIFDEFTDYSILTYGYVSELALEAIYDFFIENEINGELICFNKISEIDDNLFNDTNFKLVLTVEEGISKNGWGKMISNSIYKNRFKELNKPIINLGAKNQMIPSSIIKEQESLPSVKNIKKEIINLLKK